VAKTTTSTRIDFVTGAPVRYIPHIERLAVVVDRIEAVMIGRSAGELGRFLGPGEWSPARRLGHMIATARHTYDELYRMSWMTDPRLAAWDDDAEAQEHAWEARNPERLAQWFAEAVGQSVQFLKELPDSSWGRPGVHPEHGRRSVAQHVAEVTDYLNRQTDELERALVIEPGR